MPSVSAKKKKKRKEGRNDRENRRNHCKIQYKVQPHRLLKCTVPQDVSIKLKARLKAETKSYNTFAPHCGCGTGLFFLFINNQGFSNDKTSLAIFIRLLSALIKCILICELAAWLQEMSVRLYHLFPFIEAGIFYIYIGIH